MNIYFSCSITGGRQDELAYQAIVRMLLEEGHEVPTAHLSQPDVMALEEIVTPKDVYQRDIEWIDACDAVVAEVSTPSHGVGYEIAYGLGQNKPVLCLYQHGKRVSKMLTGNTHPAFQVLVYKDAGDAVQLVREYLRKLQQTSL